MLTFCRITMQAYRFGFQFIPCDRDCKEKLCKAASTAIDKSDCVMEISADTAFELNSLIDYPEQN